MPRSLLPVCLLLPLLACGDPADKETGDTGDTSVSRDGDYSGTMALSMSGGGGEGDCEAELTLGVLEGGEPGVSGGTCCAVEGLSEHGDVDICLQFAGTIDADDAITGFLIAAEEGDDSEPNGDWEGSFSEDGALLGTGEGGMPHEMGSTSFTLDYTVSFELQRE